MVGVRPPGNDLIEAEVRGLDEGGAGLVEIAVRGEALRVHVAGALPGERITARIMHRSAHLRSDRREAWAELEAVHTAGPERVEPVCPAYGRCGGCALMHLAYPAQLECKRARVQDELRRHSQLVSVEVAASVPSPATIGYRNQAKYVYARREDGIGVLGAYAPRSHEVVDLAGCKVIEPVLEEARGILLGILRSHQVEPYHELRRTGALRYVLLRANAAGRVLATLVAARADWAQMAGAVAAAFMQQFPALVGVVLNLNPGTGNALLGEAEEVLAGQATLDDQIGDVTVRLGSRSFFQANRAVGSRIYRDLLARFSRGLGTVVDAYSGAGGIALSLLSRSSQVVAIEENAAATSAAAALLGTSEAEAARLRLITADAAQGLAAVEHADLVVVNPPRKGCSPEVLAELRRLSPRWIAYLSCDPGTLARDLGVLAAETTVTSVVPYDMMPHTPHVETLVLLSRR